MTLINLKKSQFFLRELAQVKDSLSQLNSVDLTIKRLVSAIETFLNAPESVDSQNIQEILILAKELSDSYENHQLSESIAILLDELDFLETSQRTAKLAAKIEKFYWLSK
jgi:hypothetical protein